MLALLRVLLVALLTVSVGAIPLATAKPKKSKKASKKDKDQAKKFFLEGKSQQDAGNYAKAAKLYRKAYDLFPIPILLFNLGQVYRLDGKKHMALDYYERYLKAEPSGQGADLAKQFRTELKADIEKQEAAERERQRKEAAEADELAKQEAEASNEQEQEEDEGGSGGFDGGETSSGGGGAVLKWSGIGVAAAGAIALGFGIKYGIDAKNISDELSENRDPWTRDLLDKQDEGESAETKMFIFTAAGAAAIIGGGVLYYFGYRADADSQERMTIAPVIDSQNVGFALTGRF
ncbi:MAG: hypothetical protein KJO07_08430 [Deltaproteobacteria bacterium]|jgi:tetratricopeptide (TPR) repeat protein|nr:hypothetical protein [Deltaproteobacteria bacterium]